MCVLIKMKGFALHGIMDLSALVKWICSNSFPNDEVKLVVCDVLTQMQAIIPTAGEKRKKKANAQKNDPLICLQRKWKCLRLLLLLPAPPSKLSRYKIFCLSKYSLSLFIVNVRIEVQNVFSSSLHLSRFVA
jgi:hypothetical protein